MVTPYPPSQVEKENQYWNPGPFDTKADVLTLGQHCLPQEGNLPGAHFQQLLLTAKQSSAQANPVLRDALTISVLGIESLRRKVMLFKVSVSMASASS